MEIWNKAQHDILFTVIHTLFRKQCAEKEIIFLKKKKVAIYTYVHMGRYNQTISKYEAIL
jgi:hypothetical protein